MVVSPNSLYADEKSVVLRTGSIGPRTIPGIIGPVYRALRSAADGFVVIGEYGRLIETRTARFYRFVSHSKTLAATVPLTGVMVEAGFLALDAGQFFATLQNPSHSTWHKIAYGGATTFSLGALAASIAELLRLAPLGSVSGPVAAVAGLAFSGIELHETQQRFEVGDTDNTDLSLAASGFAFSTMSAAAWITVGAITLTRGITSPPLFVAAIGLGVGAFCTGIARGIRSHSNLA